MSGVKSVTQVAEALGISTPHVRRLVARRQLEHARIGRRIVVPQESVDRFLRGCLVPIERGLVERPKTVGAAE